METYEDYDKTGKDIKHYEPEAQKYDDGLETNLFSIAQQICSKPPQKPETIQLYLGHDCPSDMDKDKLEYELLATFTMGCIKVLFGDNVNPMKLSEDNMSLLNQYLNSIGYQMTTSVEETEKSYNFKMSFKQYEDPYKSKTNPFEHLKKYMSK